MISIEMTGTTNLPISGFKWQRAATGWATSVTPRCRQLIKAAAPEGQGPNSGRLKDSIFARPQSNPLTGVSVTFVSSAPYAKYVITGTPPHIIEANKAKALRWTGGDGHAHFAKRVNHPGTRPNPFPRRALVPATGWLRQTYRDAMIAELRRR